MSDLNILREMIKDTAKVPLHDRYRKKNVTLTEPQHANYSVTISGVPDNAVVIRADVFKSPDTVFNGSLGECRRADFIIVADTGDKKVILCIEMKAEKGPEKETIQQLRGAKCFATYCREIGREFWHRSNFLDDYVYRFVSIGHISVSKRKTRYEYPVGVHDAPEKMLKIAWPHHLQFRRLAGK